MKTTNIILLAMYKKEKTKVTSTSPSGDAQLGERKSLEKGCPSLLWGQPPPFLPPLQRRQKQLPIKF